MEAQLDDIRNNTSVASIKQLKRSILDCAKNIKSNDATFNISSLPSVRDGIYEQMGKYIDTVQKLEASQRVFQKLYERLEEQDESSLQEFIDIEQYSRLFKELVLEENRTHTTDEIEGHVELDQIIRPRPVDEEIVVEDRANLQIPKDPITKQDIKVAVRSTVCNHVYDQEAIELYFQQKESVKRAIQCPQAGCTNRSMNRSELVLDEEINRLIQS